MNITEAVMPKRIDLKTFQGDSSIITRDHPALGLSKEISHTEALRKVTISVIPLDWVYANGKSLSSLFQYFRSQQDVFQGSKLLNVMFDTFWGEFWWNLFIICFLPYLVYFIVAFMYLVMMLYEPTEEALEWQF